MNELAFVIIFALAIATAYGVGYYSARGLRKTIYTREIDAYIRSNFGTEWGAYRKGVSEGYAQGLRDGQLDEPA